MPSCIMPSCSNILNSIGSFVNPVKKPLNTIACAAAIGAITFYLFVPDVGGCSRRCHYTACGVFESMGAIICTTPPLFGALLFGIGYGGTITLLANVAKRNRMFPFKPTEADTVLPLWKKVHSD